MKCQFKVPNYEALRFFAKKFPQMEILAIEASITLSSVAAQLFSAFDTHMTRHQLSRGRFHVMMFLMRQESGEGVSPATLAENISVSRATVTGLLDTLESAGLITRQMTSQDRRAVTVHITDAGREHMNTMLPDHYRRASALMAGLTDAEKETLKVLLKKVEAGIAKVRDP